MVTNYVDPAATRTADLGPCRCPVDPKPHARDSAEVVLRFGFGEKGRIRQAGRTLGIEASYQVMILLGTKSWTLVLPDGSARPIDSDQVSRLDEIIVLGEEDDLGELRTPGFMQALLPAMQAGEPEAPLPNASGAPSSDGRSGSASPTQTTTTSPNSTST